MSSINRTRIRQNCIALLLVLCFFTTLSSLAQPGAVTYPNERSQTNSSALAQSGRINLSNIQLWFQKYDAIRRQAQMSPQERQNADELMSKGLSMIVPGPEKIESQQLLSALVNRYGFACRQLEQLPLFSQTANLHRGYYQYFRDASQLFSDYMRVQDNLFATDAMTGKPLAGQLLERKDNLESLETQVKFLDNQVRQQFGIAPYQY